MFLAITLPPEVIDQISDLPTEARRGVRYTKRSQWHITMRFLGDCERADALMALDGLRAPAAQISLGPEVGLLGTRIVMLPVEGLDEVASEVTTAFADVGEPSDREFAGHVTLARLKGAPLKDPSVVSVLGAPLSTTFMADTISLFSSDVDETGAIHKLVATQDLG